MDLEIFVAVRKNKTWFVGEIIGKKFKSYKQIGRLTDIKWTSDYITLRKYLSRNSLDLSIEDRILKSTGLDKIYVLNKPMYCGERVWDRYWWGIRNEMCVMKCSRVCKQSYFADIRSCPRIQEV